MTPEQQKKIREKYTDNYITLITLCPMEKLKPEKSIGIAWRLYDRWILHPRDLLIVWAGAVVESEMCAQSPGGGEAGTTARAGELGQ